MQDGTSPSVPAAPAAPEPDRAAVAPLPSPCAWVAQAYVGADGRAVTSPAGAALALYAVSVHEKCPTDVPTRTHLLRRVLATLAPSAPAGLASLWVFPAGFYGYDAAANRWCGCDGRLVEDALLPVVEGLPARTTLAVGVDTGGSDQQAWVFAASGGGGGATARLTVARGRTELLARTARVGPFVAAFFVCGEIVGNRSQGPYHARQRLGDPLTQLPDAHILVDLSHRRVPKGTSADSTNPRWAHDNRLRRFAVRGVGVLAHHHAGGGRFDCQSDWIVCPGDPPRYAARVQPVT